MKSIKNDNQRLWIKKGYATRFQKFQNLMRYRIRDVLIVSSLYDLYIFEEDGRLYDLVRSEYQGLNLSHTPELSHVSSGKEAIKLIKEEKRYDLIIATLHIEDMQPADFAKKIRQEGITVPIIMLAFDNRELADMIAQKEDKLFDQVFIWQGNYRLLIAMIKYLEDKKNLEHDTHIMGVQSIILIEDNIRDYSSFLPTIFIEVIHQSQRSIQEGISHSQRNLRQRARPKILLCKNYKEAWRYFEEYHDTVLGIISDIDFPKEGQVENQAGLEFAKDVREVHPDIPILLQSAQVSYRENAYEIGCEFLYKNSPTLFQDLRGFMLNYFGFGDFIFKDLGGNMVGRAKDLVSLEDQLKKIPDECLDYHAQRNHFSNWLKARTEFWLAHRLRPRKVSDFSSIEALRKHLISSLKFYRKSWQRGLITDFDKNSFDPYSSISRIGDGALGGKARGLSFFNTLINSLNVENKFEGVRIFIPSAVILTTDIFDQFLEMNDLREFALNENDDNEILKKFLRARKFPKKVVVDLTSFLELVDKPLAVRSSGLLEDSHNHPFAGVYETFMLPNSNQNIKSRLNQLIKTIKRVYASTFFNSSKEYIRATTFRLEEEKMAIIVQILCGSQHGDRFYPTFSGTAQSFNYYPVPPQSSSDGIASLALGLGKMVVEGGLTVRFSPKHPKHIIQFSTPKLALENNQRDFYALNLEEDDSRGNKNFMDEDDHFIKKYPLETAEEDGALSYIGSTYSPQNDVIYDDVSSSGVRLVSFAPILKYDILPLPQILQLLTDLGTFGMGTAVEIEFAVEMDVPKNVPKQFNVLQVRPMILNREISALRIGEVEPEKVVCRSKQVMGNGLIDNVYDIVLVDRNKYERSKSRDVAREVSKFNARLLSERRQYLLIGVGRWGSQDPWLGIPVTWEMISGARAIVETSFKDFSVTPSQGSHFFENLNSFLIGYFTIQSTNEKTFIDWDWLLDQHSIEEMEYTRLIRFDKNVIIKMNGRINEGIILKPEE